MLQALNRINQEDMKNLRKGMLAETKYKNEAMTKLEGLR